VRIDSSRIESKKREQRGRAETDERVTECFTEACGLYGNKESEKYRGSKARGDLVAQMP